MHVNLPSAARRLVASPGPGPEPTPPSRDPGTFHAVLQAQGPGVTPEPAGAGGPLKSHRSPALPSELVDVITRLRRDERRLDRHLKRALAGHQLDMPQLVALQSLAFKYSQRVELLGKLVDRLTGAVKQTLQMQV